MWAYTQSTQTNSHRTHTFSVHILHFYLCHAIQHNYLHSAVNNRQCHNSYRDPNVALTLGGLLLQILHLKCMMEIREFAGSFLFCIFCWLPFVLSLSPFSVFNSLNSLSSCLSFSSYYYTMAVGASDFKSCTALKSSPLGCITFFVLSFSLSGGSFSAWTCSGQWHILLPWQPTSTHSILWYWHSTVYQNN